MIICKECGTMNADDAITCSECMVVLEPSKLQKKGNFAEQLKKTIEAGGLNGIDSQKQADKRKETFAEQLAKSPYVSAMQKMSSAALRPPKLSIQVTSPCYDDIGKILKSLKVPYKSYNGTFNCDILFMNCGSSDIVDTGSLAKFVKKGGVLYASDLTSSTISAAFPEIFNFKGDIGNPGKITAKVLDMELREVIGEMIKIEFDLDNWSVLKSISNGDIILRSEKTKLPIMVVVPVGRGKIFYTCFHNHAQTSRQEEILLELLVLKQIGTYQSWSLKQTCVSMGINLNSYKEEMKKIKFK